MLHVENLTVRYGRMEALRNVTLAVEEGEMVAIVGGNGAGKSTLLNTVSGLVPAAGGQVKLGGKSLTGMTPDRICREGIIQVPEGRKLFAAMTVEENLIMGAYLPAQRKKVKTLLSEVYGIFPRLAERRRQLAGSLSGGEQQMVALGRAIMASPRLLMLDEPSLGLSPKAAAEIFGVVKRLNDTGITILLVSQEVLESLTIAHRGYVLENGAVALAGIASALKDDPRVKTCYLGL
ncbi:MAG: ABC transporter ATP-binding protein [Syntrophales bacterium]|nr:ABC transporter ATP-binding protein [Syntrophales bacterium]